MGLTINTFGYGVDHDSKMLQNISFSSRGGVYYYVESVKSIAATFGECLAGFWIFQEISYHQKNFKKYSLILLIFLIFFWYFFYQF